MSTRLVILGLLREQPLYGYEIKQLIEEHMNDWTSIAFGSIYFALDKLAEEGLIEKVAVEQRGNRPSRSVYQITPGGQAEFLLLLRNTWKDADRQYFNLDIGLFFISALPIDEIKVYLRARISQIETALEYLSRHEQRQLQDPAVPPVAKAIFSHSQAHTWAELDWTRDLLVKLEHGDYS
jgi:DNA-binding PadR family transcriptional regulator